MTDIGAVIGWKFNHQEGMTTRDGIITEFPDSIPSQADQDKWTKEYEEYVSANAYKEKRKAEYPTLEECVHAILDNENGELDALQAKRKIVKERHPKGGN